MGQAAAAILQQEPPLTEFTENVRRNVSITWYRTKLPAALVKSLHAKSDLHGAVQTLGYLAILAGAAFAAWYSSHHWAWYVTAALVFAYGTVAGFLIAAVHELGHGTVFKTRGLNMFFCHVFAFPGWINHETFQSSHIRHHRYTLHPPDDLEVTLPIKLMLRQLLTVGIVNPVGFWKGHLVNTVRIARGGFRGEWELTLYPASNPASHHVPVRWARALLAGHAAVLAASLATHQWIIPLLVSCGPAYGFWLMFLCGSPQHAGLRDNVDDFRLCCRTFTLNPVVQFLYWQMNYHIEHHMYAAVPCYNLGRLHRAIRHDLPPTPHGLLGVWREIAAVMRRQAAEPSHQHAVPLPENTTAPGAVVAPS